MKVSSVVDTAITNKTGDNNRKSHAKATINWHIRLENSFEVIQAYILLIHKRVGVTIISIIIIIIIIEYLSDIVDGHLAAVRWLSDANDRGKL